MRGFFVLLFMGLGHLLYFGGSFVLIGLLFYGIYVLFVKSITAGLMIIGGVVVGEWVIRIVSSLLFAVGMGTATIGVKEE